MTPGQAPVGGRLGGIARSGCRAARGAALACALLGIALASVPARAAAPAAGGAALLDAAETAAAVVVGVVRQPAPVDVHGWSAGLEVERALAGALQPGSTQRIAWEELAKSRPTRFADGDRVLVALDPLPSASLWRQRFPVTKGAAPVLVVAAHGDAFLARPDAVTVDHLGRYLTLPPDARSQGAGLDALARLVQNAEPAVAASAQRRLAGLPGVESRLGEDGRSALAAAAQDAARPLDLRAAVVSWIGRARVYALRSTLEALALPSSPLQPEATQALAELDGGVAPERSDALLQSADPRMRVVGVRFAAGSQAEQRLSSLLRSDPAPEVRAAAVEALVARRGRDSVDSVTDAFFDPSPDVRAAAARSVGALGEPVVPTLQRIALERHGADANAPIVALSMAGPAGARALLEIASSHPDPAVRKVARFALGHGPKENEVSLDPAPDAP